MRGFPSFRRHQQVITSLGATALIVAASLASSAAMSSAGAVSKSSGNLIFAVGAENEYANVIDQIGGPFVSVSAIESNPNTDPHTFEASPAVAEAVAKARLVVQNGIGYDTYMNRIEAASPSKSRKVIDVQSLLGRPNNTENPHLWYSPTTMPKVAQAVTAALESIAPSHTSYFRTELADFDKSLGPWFHDLAAVKAKYGGATVAVTEPVGDYMLQAAGLKILTPWTLQADIMNGVDPAPQAVALEESLLAKRQVKVFLYNQQVTDSVTETFLAIARQHHVPVVGVYETMPTPGYTYQSWMVAEVQAVAAALAHGTSTAKL